MSPTGIALSLLIGISLGFFGGGGSILTVPLLVYVFGLDFLSGTGANQWLIYMAAFTLLSASLVAMRKDNLKARLAYSTVSQLSYITLGAAMLATVKSRSVIVGCTPSGKVTSLM